MAKVDKLKEEIGWLKVIFAILIATDISLVAWVVQNYGENQTASAYSWYNRGDSVYICNHLDQ